MIRLGFLVQNLGASQVAYHILEECHRHLRSDDLGMDVLVFYQDATRSWKIPNFALMNIIEAYSFDGVAVATDVATAERLLRMPGPSGRFFYVWDLEWATDRHRRFEYERLASVYLDPRLPLVARSDSHAAAISRCWNREPVGVVAACDLAALRGLIDGHAA